MDKDVVNRLYLSFVLYTLLKDTNIWSVSEKFNLPRGYIQNLLTGAASFSSCVLHFCEVIRLNTWHVLCAASHLNLLNSETSSQYVSVLIVDLLCYFKTLKIYLKYIFIFICFT